MRFNSLFNNRFAAFIATFLPLAAFSQHAGHDYAIQPVPFTQVQLTDHFWKPRLETNAAVTIPYILQKCRDEKRIDNFLAAAGKVKRDKLSDFPFDDTDLYKLIEGASYCLQEQYNPVLDKQLDTLIAIIGEAQEPDGYLYTFRTAKVTHPHEWIGEKRWVKDEDLSHELYNSGHLYEAAVAHFDATKKRSLIDIAIRNADLLVQEFGPGKLSYYPGHQIVELGLVKMYRATGKKAYLDLAKFFLDIRGPKGDAYNQAHQRVIDQVEAKGHAVRAAYMYTGMADVAALTGDKAYVNAINHIWNDVAMHKLYITGGIGATGNGEAFGAPYDLPNMSAYAETCASIGNVYWNQRMFLLHGDSKYFDMLERTLYNGLLSGISLSGNRFFYPNPLASVGQHQRSAWFSCACCISNMTRFLPSMPGYMYAQNNNQLYINLFASNKASIKLPVTTVNLQVQTEYPWNGKVEVSVNPAKNAAFAVHIRIPGWAVGKAMDGDLYAFENAANPMPVIVKVNGKQVAYKMEKGYAVVLRSWKKADKIEITFPMPVQKVLANENVKADAGRFALQRGPVLYCLEGIDQSDSTVQSIVVDTATAVKADFVSSKLNGIMQLQMPGKLIQKDQPAGTNVQVTAIPYYSWNNRGSGEMEVWIPYKEEAARPKPLPTIASKCKVSGTAKSKLMLKALNDQFEPANSRDQTTNYLHWWPLKNTTEWLQYDFDKPYTVSESSVYWFDDKPWGGCAVPASWELQYKTGDKWEPVKLLSTYGNAKDVYNTAKFAPVTTTALRLVVKLPENDAAGVHEWIVK